MAPHPRGRITVSPAPRLVVLDLLRLDKAERRRIAALERLGMAVHP